MAIWRMRIACWIPMSSNMHSEYVILIAFPPQQRLHERATMLRYTYISGLVYGLLTALCELLTALYELLTALFELLTALYE